MRVSSASAFRCQEDGRFGISMRRSVPTSFGRDTDIEQAEVAREELSHGVRFFFLPYGVHVGI